MKENGWFFEPSCFHNLASIEDMTIRYLVAIREENGTYCATVPDLPGVITEANSIDELVCAIEEASLGWMEAEIDDGREIPKPSLVEKLFKDKDYKNCIWVFADIDLDKLSIRSKD